MNTTHSLIFVMLLVFGNITSILAQRNRDTLESVERINLINRDIQNEFRSQPFLKEDKPNLNEEKSANGNCANAAMLSIAGTPQCYNFSTDNFQSGETSCISCSAYGLNSRSIWYMFQANSNSTTVNLNTNENYWATTWSIDNLAIYGPYSSAANATANCIPNSTQRIACVADYVYSYDPLFSYSIPTTSGSFYMIQVTNCEDSWDTYWHTGCIWVNPTPPNNVASAGGGIDECGTVYNGTNIGYSPSNGLPGMENLDGNSGTTCPGCTSGEDVTYVVNNDSWFYFCATVAGTYNVNFSNITNCINNDGLQMTIFRGTPTNLTTVWNAASPSLPGSNQTSPNFNVGAGECIYMMVDGFAADQCNYSYTLNAVTPCELTPLSSNDFDFFGYNNNRINFLKWSDELAKNALKIERSIDGTTWESLQIDTSIAEYKDQNYKHELNYYKLTSYNESDNFSWNKIITIDNRTIQKQVQYYTNTIGQKIDLQKHTGFYIIVFEDGTIERRFK